MSWPPVLGRWTLHVDDTTRDDQHVRQITACRSWGVTAARLRATTVSGDSPAARQPGMAEATVGAAHQRSTRQAESGARPGTATPADLRPEHASLLELQATAGNAAVASMLQRVPSGSTVTATPERLAASRSTTATSDTITVAGTEGAAPYDALKALHLQAGKNVVEMTAHEWKVERYGRFLEGDNLYLRQAKATLVQALASRDALRTTTASNRDPQQAKALQKQSTDNEKRLALAKAAFATEGDVASDPTATADQAIAAADTRLAFGLEAQSRTAAEKPVVGLAYDETKKLVAAADAADPAKLKKGAGSDEDVLAKLKEQRREADFGEVMGDGGVATAEKRPPADEGRIAKWRRERAERAAVAEKAKKRTALDGDIGRRERAAEFPAIVGQANRTATPLVQQSILSEQVVAVKRKQLKAMKGTIKGTFKRGTTLAKHVTNKVASGVAGAIVSAATFGAVDVDARKTQGGYKSERRLVNPWTRLKEDLASLRRIADARKDGAFGTSYLVLKGFNELFVKQVRNVFGGLATTLGLLGLIPGAQPLLGLAAICAVVSLGAAGMKLLVDTVLTAWNAVASSRNKDAYNERMLKGELVATGMDALGSGLRVAGAFAGPLAANAAFGAAGAGAGISNPLEMAEKVGGIQGGGDLSGIASLSGGVKMDKPLDYATQQGIKGAGLATSAGSTVAGKIAGAVSGTEGLGSGASGRLEHDDRDQWKTVPSKLDGARGEARSVPRAGGAGGTASKTMAAELEKEAAVKNAARAGQGRWARDQGLGLVGRIEELQDKVANVATGVATTGPAAAKDGPEAAEDAAGSSGAANEAVATMGSVAALLKDGAAEAVGP
jgi:hypothetical protein